MLWFNAFDLLGPLDNSFRSDPIVGYSVKNISDFGLDYLIHAYESSGFTAGAVGRACNLIEKMLADPEISIFMSLSGALIPAGQQKFLVEIVKSGRISGIVSTGATLTHDYLEDLGFAHLPVGQHSSDADLRSRGINRIFDRMASDEGFIAMEKDIHVFLEELVGKTGFKKSPLSTSTLLKHLGTRLSDRSLLGVAARSNTPIYCPAITDSILGVHMMTFREFNSDLLIDPLLELKMFVSQCFDCKKTAAIVFGGGVPKNYLFQSMLTSGKELSYAIQVTMDRPEHGGLSGASLEEAISWGKIDSRAGLVTVMADVTLILPIFAQLFKKMRK